MTMNTEILRAREIARAAEAEWKVGGRRGRLPDHIAAAFVRALPPKLPDVAGECARQDAKWGEQNHPNGTGPEAQVILGRHIVTEAMVGEVLARIFKERTDERFAGEGDRPGTWADILLEEVFEALAEDDPERLQNELIQVAAVAVQWAAAIDRWRAVR